MELVKGKKAKAVNPSVDTARQLLEVAESEERDAAKEVKQVRWDGAALRDPSTPASVVAAHQRRHDAAVDRLEKAQRETRNAQAALEAAEAREDEADPGHPRVWRWERDPALTALRREQDDADQDRVAEAAIDKAMFEVETTRHEFELATHLKATGGGSDSAVHKAENEMNRAQHSLSALRGKQYMQARISAGLAGRAKTVLAEVQAASAKKFQTAAAIKAKELHRLLSEARQLSIDLRRIQAAAEASFPWSSPQAQVHGQAAGLPDAAFTPCLHDQHAINGGLLGDWLVRTSKLRGQQSDEDRERDERYARQRRAQEEVAKAQREAYEYRSRLVWSAHEREAT